MVGVDARMGEHNDFFLFRWENLDGPPPNVTSPFKVERIIPSLLVNLSVLEAPRRHGSLFSGRRSVLAQFQFLRIFLLTKSHRVVEYSECISSRSISTRN